jgi:glycoside/pentoside/hexuronide:cation symporter, GPH family
VSLPLWTWLARRLGKDRALKLCMLWGTASLAVVPIVFSPDMSALRMGTFLVLAGLGNGGWAVLPVAITADIVDTDELETYRRREGAYFGMWMLALKLATGLASGIVGLGLQLVGYVPNAVQTDGAILGIKLLYGPIPAVILLLGLALFYRFPLTRERHAEVQAALAARRG